ASQKRHRLEFRPFIVGQVTRISQFAAVVTSARRTIPPAKRGGNKRHVEVRCAKRLRGCGRSGWLATPPKNKAPLSAEEGFELPSEGRSCRPQSCVIGLSRRSVRIG